MPQCCPQSPLYFLYPGRPMEQTFSYTRDNIPPIPPITKEMKPQIPHNYPLPFQGPEIRHRHAGTKQPPKGRARRDPDGSADPSHRQRLPGGRKEIVAAVLGKGRFRLAADRGPFLAVADRR